MVLFASNIKVPFTVGSFLLVLQKEKQRKLVTQVFPQYEMNS